MGEKENVKGLNKELDEEIEELEDANRKLENFKNAVTKCCGKEDSKLDLPELTEDVKQYINGYELCGTCSVHDHGSRRLAAIPSQELPPTPRLDSPTVISPSIMIVASLLVIF